MSVSTAPASSKKVDYKKDFKWLYLPKEKPELVEVPALLYLSIEGSGSPDAPAFSEAVEALYALSYAVKMSYKSSAVPEGYYEYTVFPLEGVWDLVDCTATTLDKDNFKYTLMIRQPDFLTLALYERFLAEVGRKKPGLPLSRVKLTTLTEGTCCQMMHMGSYADEPASFAAMEAYCAEQGWVRASKTHREIYLSDPRKIETAKLKTVLRFRVAKK
jgi:hypothetical protein